MHIMKPARLIPSACALYLAAACAMAAEPAPVVEYCGTDAAPALKSVFRWDCSNTAPASMGELEESVAQSHTLLAEGQSPRFYESQATPGSFWVFFKDSAAVRYRALYDGDRYLGIGLSVFCSGTREDCLAVQSTLAQVAPPLPVMSKVGPPAPVAPDILFEP